MSKSVAGYLIISINMLAYDPAVLGLHGQVLVTGDTGMASVRSCPNFPPYLATSGISWMVPLLAKAEPIRMYLPYTFKKGKNLLLKCNSSQRSKE